MRTLVLAALAVAVASGVAQAQPTPIGGLDLKSGEAAARRLIDAACGKVTRVAVAESRFPSASRSEVHLRCQGLTLADGRPAGDAIFTFADDSLVMIETHDPAVALAPDAEPVTSIGAFEVFMPQRILVNRQAGQAWMVADPSYAALAISWKNPAWRADQVTAPAAIYATPAQVVFGASLDEVQASVQDQCDLTHVEDIEDIWLATHPAVQQQLDCIGMEIAGYPRQLEFVFGDGKLEQVWILFGPADVDRLRQTLTATYGPPDSVDEVYEAFDGWRIAIRKDKSEILLGSEPLAAIWRREGHP